MSEQGGASTQAGIFYQNSIAALALADLLELAPLPARDRVTSVRVEAPEEIDDIVIKFADGHTHYNTVKTVVQPNHKAWKKMWQNIEQQSLSKLFQEEDRLILSFADPVPTTLELREICDRASTSVEEAEWLVRLSEKQRSLLEKIKAALVKPERAKGLLARISVHIQPLQEVEREFARKRSGKDLTPSKALLSILRDMAGGNARKRGFFIAPNLRRQLMRDYEITLAEPREWGLLAYRASLESLARIEIPGTNIAGPSSSMFIWPRARFYEHGRQSDFEDESLDFKFNDPKVMIDLQNFPTRQLRKCVVIAGPGHGKSALLTALSGLHAEGPYVPVTIPLGAFAASDNSILEFLSSYINREFDVQPDWQRLAEQGLIMLLFDGLDEVPANVRSRLIKRISTFSARFPTNPWILTVRDPSILIGLPDASNVELLPLNDSDILRFVEAMKNRLPQLDEWSFTRRLERYPDLRRLARIPLFLSMLLAMVQTEDDIPKTRADLIEAYLKTLFSPHEHKSTTACLAMPSKLRQVVESLAFERLEKQEIGASEREVRGAIQRTIENQSEVDEIFSALLSNGILRRQSTIRLQFPFPIVQEYLAANYLVENAESTLSDRIDDAIQRPWAQVIQFALELHPNPELIIEAMIYREDDAFSTGLRLVGRCVANGAKISEKLRAEVGSKLTKFWISSPYHTRERVGQLLADGFANPPSVELKKALHHSWLFNDGAGDIISILKDEDLTLSVLDSMLANLERFSLYHPLKPAFQAVGEKVFDNVVEFAETAELDDEQWSGIEGLLSHLTPNSVERTRALNAAENQNFPIDVRLELYEIAGAPLPNKALKLVKQSLMHKDEIKSWRVSKVLALHPKTAHVLFDLLRDKDIAVDRRTHLVGGIVDVIPQLDERNKFLDICRSDKKVPRKAVDIGLLFSARFGNKTDFDHLISRLSNLELELAQQVIMLFGHYPDQKRAELAAQLIDNRQLDSEEAVRLAQAATTGMLYVYDMDFYMGGVLHDAMPHAGIGSWTVLIEKWVLRNDLTPVQKLSLLASASKLGSDSASERLEQEVISIENPDDPIYADKDGFAHELLRAISEVQNKLPRFPIPLATCLVRSKLPNAPAAGIRAIEAYENREALDLLLELHQEPLQWLDADTLKRSIESLSGKLELVIRKSEGVLTVV